VRDQHSNIVPWQAALRREKGAILKGAPMDDEGPPPRRAGLPVALAPPPSCLALLRSPNALRAPSTQCAPIVEMAHRRKGLCRGLLDGAQAVLQHLRQTAAMGCDFYVLLGTSVRPHRIGRPLRKSEC